MTRLVCLSTLLFVGSAAQAKITNPVTLEQLVKDMPVIATAKVGEFLPEKPGLVFTPGEVLRGEFAFDRVPVNLTGDKEAIDEKQPPALLERLGKDVPVVLFISRRGKRIDALAYTNGTWFRMDGTVEAQDGKDVTRWRFTHCETYFRKTFKGTTDELLTAIKAGLKGGKLPAYDEKEAPGLGPVLKKGPEEKKPLAISRSPTLSTEYSVLSTQYSPDDPERGTNALPFAVIQLPFLGLIAALAALFPAVFGGAAIFMRRWVAALSIAGFISLLIAIHNFFPKWIEWSGIRTPSSAWLAGGTLAAIGALWSGYRYRRAIRDGKSDEFQPRYADRIGLAIVAILCVGGIGIAKLLKEPLDTSPWLELTLFLVPTIACFYFVVSFWLRTRNEEPRPVPISAETVGLWAGTFACGLAGVALMAGPSGPAMVGASGKSTVRLDEQPLWVFNPPDKGEILSTPCVTPERVYVAVHHRPNPVSQFGVVYALDPKSGGILWKFDDDENLKPLFCTPIFADGRLYFGEGYHTDRDSKMYCVDASTGKKVWDFPTGSHTESSPAFADGKVVFGAGDDGLYALDAKSGQKLWQYPAGGGLHVDSNPLIHNGRVFAASGTSQRSKTNRLFCLDLATGNEVWTEKVEYSCWGSPSAYGNQVYLPTGNGTFSEDRAPVAGLLLCRDAATGKPIWERALPNSIVVRPAADRYQVYVGCRDGNLYALDRHTGEIIWSKTLQAPVLASPAIDANPKSRVGETVYGIGSAGQVEALSAADGSLAWAVNLRGLVGFPYVSAVSSPIVVREETDGKLSRRIYVGLGFGSNATATPNARLYCFRDVSE